MHQQEHEAPSRDCHKTTCGVQPAMVFDQECSFVHSKKTGEINFFLEEGDLLDVWITPFQDAASASNNRISKPPSRKTHQSRCNHVLDEDLKDVFREEMEEPPITQAHEPTAVGCTRNEVTWRHTPTAQVVVPSVRPCTGKTGATLRGHVKSGLRKVHVDHKEFGEDAKG